MRKEELRIGNWVKEAGHPIEEEQYNLMQIHSVLPKTVKTSWDEVKGASFDYDQLEPIPLTEEWFIKLGGEKELYQDDEDDYYLVTRHKDFDFIYENDATVFCDIAGVVIPLKYVHQLQNLYHL